jgi:hypothetical protein
MPSSLSSTTEHCSGSAPTDVAACRNNKWGPGFRASPPRR